MTSPLKPVSSLFLNLKHISPRSPKLLSPKQNSALRVSPVKLSAGFINSPKLARQCDSYSVKKIEIKVTDDTSKEEILLIDSPHKTKLLNEGLSKFDMLFSIGKGSFGTVIKGKYKGKIVAVKLISLNSDDINESNALHLVHKNIIQTLDIVTSSKYGLVIMEYCRNSKNLQCLLDDHDFIMNKETVLKYTKDVASGLKHCHENDVIHLDIKPKNILVCDETTCKICDFGNSIKASNCLDTYEFHGTIAYTAPEILKGKKPSATSDVYSLGIMIWQMLSRKSPYKFLESEVVIYKVVKFNYRPFLTEKDDLSNLCRLCWQSNPNERPGSAKICDILEMMSYK